MTPPFAIGEGPKDEITATGQGGSAPAGPSYPAVLENVVRAYILAVFAAGIGMLVLAAVTAHNVSPVALLVFCAAAALGELMRMRVTYESVSISLTLIVNLAAVIALGPLGAAASGATAATAAGIWLRPRPELRKTLFNIGLFSLCTGAAGFAYQLAGGRIGVGNHGADLRDGLACAAALLANFAVNWPLVIGIVHLTSGKPVKQIWNDSLRWTIIQIGVAAAIGFTLGAAYLLFGWPGAAVYLLPVVALRESIRQYTSKVSAQLAEVTAAHAEADTANRRLAALNRELDETNAGLLKTLASVIDARDIYLYGHSVQAARYAKEVAERLELPAEEIKNAEYGALLHDIGKIGVSEAILNKPARLTEDEYREVQTHCEIGYALLSNLPHFASIADVVRSHHEEWDGTGYPRGLAGEDIPIAARIVSVVEATEAMVSDRPYRKGMSPDEVLEELRRGAGTQWDPRVIEVFSAILSQDRKHLAMRNSALEVALSRTPIAALIGAGKTPGMRSLQDMTATFDGAEQPIFILDDQLRVVSINPNAERITGYRGNQLEGTLWADMCMAEELRMRLSPEFFSVPRVVMLRRADEGGVNLEISATPLKTNSAAYWLLIAHRVGDGASPRLRPQEAVAVDQRTGLAPRESFTERLLEAMRGGVQPLTVAVVEIDGLAAIVETFGAQARDEALGTLGRTLRTQLRQVDLGAHWDDDRCAVLMPGSTPQDAVRVMARIEANLPAAYAAQDFPVDTHHGIAAWDGRERLEDLMARALQALRESTSPSRSVVPLRVRDTG
ncbi:MAG TPA: HD domain-containing phosphohydrolase [Candidatus Dormibacteraeota bacterium]|nr:HD domain-containing phosphohydrolase [Candidatus Dormibacteraeota bacterium]